MRHTSRARSTSLPLQLGHGLGNGLRRQTLGLQFLAHPHRAQARRPSEHHRFEHALFVDEALGLQIVQRPRQLAGLGFVLAQLALQFGARVLALTQQAQRAPFE